MEKADQPQKGPTREANGPLARSTLLNARTGGTGEINDLLLPVPLFTNLKKRFWIDMNGNPEVELETESPRPLPSPCVRKELNCRRTASLPARVSPLFDPLPTFATYLCPFPPDALRSPNSSDMALWSACTRRNRWRRTTRRLPAKRAVEISSSRNADEVDRCLSW